MSSESQGDERRDQQGRWRKGVSGNAGGRPQGRGLQAEVERELRRRDGGKTRLQRLAEVIVGKALEGDLRACELVARRLWPEKMALQHEGMPRVDVQVVDFSGRHRPATRLVEVFTGVPAPPPDLGEEGQDRQPSRALPPLTARGPRGAEVSRPALPAGDTADACEGTNGAAEPRERLTLDVSGER